MRVLYGSDTVEGVDTILSRTPEIQIWKKNHEKKIIKQFLFGQTGWFLGLVLPPSLVEETPKNTRNAGMLGPPKPWSFTFARREHHERSHGLLGQRFCEVIIYPGILAGGNSNIFYFSSLFGEMIQFDEHIFQMGWLKPPTRILLTVQKSGDHHFRWC